MPPTSKLPRYVVDASVAVKWHLRDEADLSHADALLADFREGRIQLIAPEQIRYEVPSAIRNSLRTGRLTSSEARTAIADFLAWRFPTVRTDVLILSAFDWALNIGCSLYDGLYLALAQMADCPLVLADLRLHHVLSGRFSDALWLTDYPMASTRRQSASEE